MEKIVVSNSGPLSGSVKVSGAKNAALPIIAASLLGTEPIILENVPKLSDINVILKVLESLGSKVKYLDENTVEIDSSNLTGHIAPMELMNRMRASFLVMGPLLARRRESMTYLPGGCAIGKRPIDLHLKGFKALGAKINESLDRIEAVAEDGLKGDVIYIDFPSVGATQNIMMAATLAQGETVIENAAKEPEIVDLANFLNKLGANIKGAGTSAIRIKGVEKLGGGQHAIIPDRIEAATYMIAGAITRGDVTVENCIPSHVMPIVAKLKEVGCKVYVNEDKDVIRIIGTDNLIGTDVKTLPYPGFPTDAQAQFMALDAVADGTGRIVETIFENRFMHVPELQRMGADIAVDGHTAVVRGVEALAGTNVMATDLRASACLVIAGLAAHGETVIDRIYHLDRGYEHLETKLSALGADIVRIK